jgi:hypothetical protein
MAVFSCYNGNAASTASPYIQEARGKKQEAGGSRGGALLHPNPKAVQGTDERGKMKEEIVLIYHLSFFICHEPLTTGDRGLGTDREW